MKFIMGTMYIHERENWTQFRWDEQQILPLVADVRLSQGKLLGRISDLGFSLDSELEVDAIAKEVSASSRIEGVHFNDAQVRSSVARSLGVFDPAPTESSREIDGAVSILLDAVTYYDQPFTYERLAGWHNALFPTGYSGLHAITVAEYRKGPMSVVSGPIGHEKVHYQAPEATDVPRLMDKFFTWLNAGKGDSLVNAAIAHLWFLTLHPFDDGNGRIARALTEAMLARSDKSKRRFYSMASYILAHREDYYTALEKAQKGTSDITTWLIWFLHALKETLNQANTSVDAVLARDRWWRMLDGVDLNERQRLMLKKLLSNFEGKLTTAKWAKICKVSPDTALRDINDLIAKGILVADKTAGGRSTSYLLANKA